MPLTLGSKSYFSVRQDPTKGIQHHFILQLKRNRLMDREAVAELKEKILPQFMRGAGIEGLIKRGFRMVVEALTPTSTPEIHLISDDTVLSQNPQDWLTPPVTWNPGGPAVFFEKCAEAAGENAPKMAFGNEMLYVGEARDIFGVVDGDPKSETHFLVLASEAFSSIMEEGFTPEHLARFFETAYQIFATLNVVSQPIRLVINSGTGFQVGPRVHMHCQSAPEGLPSMFPLDYGFEVAAEGIIVAPKKSEPHSTAVKLIRQRQEIQGFSPEAKAGRISLDSQLRTQLKIIEIK
ncbi:MAG: HIT domain-containing protein [Candidatus Saganbacteria bacterium]|nr:HIT domain-containing protein [Candidatus Saganbacteria bacterium]